VAARRRPPARGVDHHEVRSTRSGCPASSRTRR
jgi:hypothetical protein